jgi:hypothetical protein
MSALVITRPPGRLIALAVLGVALAGLFAMHGLSAHGTAQPLPETVGVHAEHDPDLPGGVPAEQGHHDALLVLCVALLVAGVVVLAARGGSIRWATRDAGPSPPSTAPWTSRRDRDPPDLHALSILRC